MLIPAILKMLTRQKKNDFAKNRKMQTIPPIQNALIQHSKRVAYQAALWTTSQLGEQHVPSPEGWGSEVDCDSLTYLFGVPKCNI